MKEIQSQIEEIEKGAKKNQGQEMGKSYQMNHDGSWRMFGQWMRDSEIAVDNGVADEEDGHNQQEHHRRAK